MDAEDELIGSVVRALRGDEGGVEHALDESISRFRGSHDGGRSTGHHAQRVLRRINVPDLYRRCLEAEADGGDFDPRCHRVSCCPTFSDS